MSNLRKLAEGQSCYARLPTICNFDRATVVLAHIRRGNVAGIGQKPSDLCALPLCDACHAVFDGRMKTHMSRAQIDADVLRGLCQWLAFVDAEISKEVENAKFAAKMNAETIRDMQKAKQS